METNKVLHKQYNNTINQLFNVLPIPIDVRKTINISMDMGALYICIHYARIPILLALTSYQKYFHKETNYPCLNILLIFAKGPLAKHV